MSEFDKNLFKCKAVIMEDDNTVVCGYYSQQEKHHLIDGIDINPYTLCRNTGVKVLNEYIYEFDLIEYKNGLSNWHMGIIDWDDFNKCFAIRTSLNYSSKRDIGSVEIRVIGNIILNYLDMGKMQAYSDEQDKNYSPNPATECRSAQHLNKLSKQHLPRS